MKYPASLFPLLRGALVRLLFATSLLLVAVPRHALAQAPNANPPTLMTYQGYLVDANGTALATNAPKNYDVIFRIYNASSGSGDLWSEQQTVTVDKGYFNVLLGEGGQYNTEPHPALATLFSASDASDRYVEITVKGIGSGGSDVIILPRLRLLTSPYAFLAQRAISANTASNVDGSAVNSGTVADARLSGNIARLNVTQTFTGGNNFVTAGNIPVVVSSSSTIGTWFDIQNTSAGGIYWQLISTGSGNGEGAGKLVIGSGANAGSTVGVMTLQNNGNVGIGTPTPASRLQVIGDIRLGSSGGNYAASSGENLRIIRGTVDNFGHIWSGTGFTVVSNTVGDFIVSFTQPFSGAPSVVVNGSINNPADWNLLNNANFHAEVFDHTGNRVNWWFSFIAMGPP